MFQFMSTFYMVCTRASFVIDTFHTFLVHFFFEENVRNNNLYYYPPPFGVNSIEFHYRGEHETKKNYFLLVSDSFPAKKCSNVWTNVKSCLTTMWTKFIHAHTQHISYSDYKIEVSVLPRRRMRQPTTTNKIWNEMERWFRFKLRKLIQLLCCGQLVLTYRYCPGSVLYT